MKGIHKSCASQAATAICLSMDPSSSPSSHSTLLSRSAAIDRHNPIIGDSRRTHTPITTVLPDKNHSKKNKSTDFDGGRKSVGRKSWSCTKPGDFISPPGSTRYLLSEKVLFNALSDLDPSLKLVPSESTKANESQSNSSSASPNQEVVLRVSLHCRGCERKMRKHISRMQGVTSFNIDFAAKKVTVTGNITPLEVLSSISKVKKAQLWYPSTSVNPNRSEFNNTASGGVGA